jgi:nucleotide-binding universal stress UspA family protein
MAYAKILVPVTGAKNDALALETAFAAAAPFEAHVEAFFAHPDPREVVSYVYSGVPVAPALIQSIIDGQTKLADDAQSVARSALMATAKDAGAAFLASPARNAGLSCSFRARYGFVPHLIADAARLADLVVFKPSAGEERNVIASAMLETLVRANRPVLLPAQERPASLARSIAIGWDGRDAAAHAITAAIPFLKLAARIEILTVQTVDNLGAESIGALTEYLDLHGIIASHRNVSQKNQSVSACLTESATAAGADLLVMGGYGHSHLRETFLGGVTMDVVSHHALPVFLMH